MKDFLLPERWCILSKGEEHHNELLLEWLKKMEYEYPDWDGYDYYYHVWKSDITSATRVRDYDYTQLTDEQFKQYVLGMKEEQKEIVGYRLKDEYVQYKYAAACVGNYIPIYDVQSEYIKDSDKDFDGKSIILKLKQAGVLDLWFEPVYKKEETFCVGDWVYAERQPTDDYRHEKGNKYIPVFKIEEIYEGNFGDTWLRPEVRCTSGISSKYCRKATPEEIAAAQTPQIVVNGYKAEFFDEYVKFGCATISKYVFISLSKIKHDTTNRDVESVTIGKGTFTKEQIKSIAEYYLNKK